MARFAQESDSKDSSIAFKNKLGKNEYIPPMLELAYEEIQAYVDQHQAKGARSSRPEDWHDNQRGWLRDLRYGYFHFSAQAASIPNAPRYIDGKRQRMTRPG